MKREQNGVVRDLCNGEYKKFVKGGLVTFSERLSVFFVRVKRDEVWKVFSRKALFLEQINP